MDEPASDRISGNVVVAIVVLVIAVAALVLAGFLMTRDSGDSVTAGGTSAPSGTTPGSAVAPGTTPGSAPTACKSSATVPRPLPEPTDELTAAVQAALVGCPETDATKRAQAAGWTVRVTDRDGEGFAVTMDYLPSRLGFAVTGGVVTEVSIG